MVAWTDLLGRPWRLHGTDRHGMDCSTVSEEILRRLGKTPPVTNPHRIGVGGEEAYGVAFESYMSQFDDAYEEIGTDVRCATKEGDLVLAKTPEGAAHGLYVLVSPDRGTFLTAHRSAGVVATRRYTIRSDVVVYRLLEGGR